MPPTRVRNVQEDKLTIEKENNSRKSTEGKEIDEGQISKTRRTSQEYYPAF